ncbi:MAG: cytochrome c maturation protein CcmE [Candidatus Latescibacterota bacterium]
MPRTRFAVGAAIILVGLVYLIVAGFQQSQATHMTVSALVDRAQRQDVGQLRIQLGGQVVEGSIEWDEYRHRARFVVTEGGARVPVRYIGNAVLPDTFKDGSPVVVEGRYAQATGVFEAEVVMAKCPSKYEGQSYEGHLDAIQTSN